MTKRVSEPPKPRTYFEQIPVDAVKKVRVPDLSKKRNTDKGAVMRESASRKTGPYSMGAHRDV